jgi:hypothetical protein
VSIVPDLDGDVILPAGHPSFGGRVWSGSESYALTQEGREKLKYQCADKNE